MNARDSSRPSTASRGPDSGPGTTPPAAGSGDVPGSEPSGGRSRSGPGGGRGGREEARDTDARSQDALRGSRTSHTWVGLVLLLVPLVLLIIFIAQNTRPVEVSFFGFSGQTPLAVALLIAAALGLLIAGAAGGLRIWQLRRRVRRLDR